MYIWEQPDAVITQVQSGTTDFYEVPTLLRLTLGVVDRQTNEAGRKLLAFTKQHFEPHLASFPIVAHEDHTPFA